MSTMKAYMQQQYSQSTLRDQMQPLAEVLASVPVSQSQLACIWHLIAYPFQFYPLRSADLSSPGFCSQVPKQNICICEKITNRSIP